MILQLEVGAIVQGTVIAIAIIGLLVVYFDRMSTMSNNIGSLSNSIENVHEDIQEVDLKHMERTTNKLETFLEAELSAAYNGRNSTGGQNSVQHTLDQSDLSVVISYVGNPEWHAGLTQGDADDEIVFQVKFDEEVDTQGLVGLLTRDRGLIEKDKELFNDDDPRITADSPFQMSAAVPTEDMDMAGEWVEVLVDSIDENVCYIRKQQNQFDKVLDERIDGSSRL